MKVISIANQKGGVSKTTTAQAITELWNQEGKKTLAVDLDPQGNLTFAMGVDIENNPTIYNVLKGELNINDILQHTHLGDMLPANLLLSGSDMEFTSTGREYLLRESIQDISYEYDYLIIDCPPSLSILTINAFTASDYIVIPAISDVFSLQGMGQLNNTIQKVIKYCNPNLKIAGILLTKFNSRTNLSNHIKFMLDGFTENMNTKLFSTYIRNSVSIQEGQFQRESLVAYSKSNAMDDYKKFIKELESIINGD